MFVTVQVTFSPFLTVILFGAVKLALPRLLSHTQSPDFSYSSASYDV